MTDLPPLGGRAPGLRCSRLLRFPDESSQCPNDATHHILWNDDGQNGLNCSEHAAEASANWHPVDSHPYDPTCSIAGAVWIFDDPSRCVVDDVPTSAAEVEANAAVVV